jgi:hypothetical protein
MGKASFNYRKPCFNSWWGFIAALPEEVVAVAAVAVVVIAVVVVTSCVHAAIQEYRNSHVVYSRSSPEESGIPNSTKLKRNNKGKLEGYSTYGPDGKLRKQVRLTGKAHGDIERPNVKEPDYNVNPKTKQRYKNGYRVRKARKYELPKGYR